MFASLRTEDKVDRAASDRAHKLLQKIEAAYEKEDEAMLIRLIKIRNSLWT
jgi:RNA polymerase-binding transcription factor DksA